MVKHKREIALSLVPSSQEEAIFNQTEVVFMVLVERPLNICFHNQNIVWYLYNTICIGGY